MTLDTTLSDAGWPDTQRSLVIVNKVIVVKEV